MADRAEPTAPLLGVQVVAAEDVGAWTIRVVVEHRTKPVTAWVPLVFWNLDAANAWLDDRRRATLVPAVCSCEFGSNRLGLASVRDERGEDVVLSEPVPRVYAAGVAALLASELRGPAPS